MMVMVASRTSEATAMKLLCGRTGGRVAMAAIADYTARSNNTPSTANTNWGTSCTRHPRCVNIGTMVDEDLDNFNRTTGCRGMEG